MTLAKRSRRLKALSRSPLLPLITFPVRQDWFALPIQVAQKVVPLPAIATPIFPNGVGAAIAAVDQQALPLIDLESHIYRERPLLALPPASPTAESFPAPPHPLDSRYVLIIRPLHLDDPIGLLISQPPVLRRVPQTAFAPLPAVYLTVSQLHCVNAMVVLPDQAVPLFMLDLNPILGKGGAQ